MNGRRQPYTDTGIRRLWCVRCKKRKATQQWQICADGNLYRPICFECDIALNRIVLDFMEFDDVDGMMERYAAQHEEAS